MGTMGRKYFGPHTVSFAERYYVYCTPISGSPLSKVPLTVHRAKYA